MVTIRLSGEDASFLSEQLERQAAHVESELVRTDASVMQHELAIDLQHLKLLLSRLERARAEPESSFESVAGEQPPPDHS